jgi:hypothetical protein
MRAIFGHMQQRTFAYTAGASYSKTIDYLKLGLRETPLDKKPENYP